MLKPSLLVELELLMLYLPETILFHMQIPVISTPHWPLSDDSITIGVVHVIIKHYRHSGLDLRVNDIPTVSQGCEEVTDLRLCQFAVARVALRILLYIVVELSEVIVLQVVLLDGRPVLPPAQLTISVPIKVVEARFEGIHWNVRVRIITLDHHVILPHPLIVRHDSIVGDCFLHIALALGMVPEPTDESIVIVVLVMLPLFDLAIVVCVTELELVADVGLKAFIIVDNVVQAVKLGQRELQVFPCVAITAYFTFGVITGATSQKLKNIILDRLLVERSLIALQVDWVVFRAIVLKELLKTDL